MGRSSVQFPRKQALHTGTIITSVLHSFCSFFDPRNVEIQRCTVDPDYSVLTFNPAARLNQPSAHFTLSPTSGELRTSSRLDREGRDGSDSVDLVALSSSPTYPIEASRLLISILFPHVSKQMEGGLADHVGERWCHGYE